MLPTGSGKRWAEFEPHDRKIATHREVPSFLTFHPLSRDPDKRNDIFRSQPYEGRHTFSVVYFAMIILAFLAPEPRVLRGLG